MTITMVRGDSKSIPFVVLGKPVSASGVWTWDGTLTVLSANTSGVSVGNWVRNPEASTGLPSGWFKVATVNTNVSIVVVNPDGLDVPTGVGVDVSVPVDLTGAVVRATARKGKREAWRSTNYTDPDGIELTDPAAGEGTWHITPADQLEEKAGSFSWDIETNRQGSLRVSTGTATVGVGSDVIAFSDPAVVAAARYGDIFIGTGAIDALSQIPVVIVATPSTDATLAATELRTDYTGWVAETFAFELRRGTRKTPAGLSGALVLDEDSTIA